MMDRREFVATAAAALGAPLVSAAGQNAAQTSAGSSPPLPPDNGLGLRRSMGPHREADIFLRHGARPAALAAARQPDDACLVAQDRRPLSRRFHIVAAGPSRLCDSVSVRQTAANHVNYSFRGGAG
jgi:hypothetical protein